MRGCDDDDNFIVLMVGIFWVFVLLGSLGCGFC